MGDKVVPQENGARARYAPEEIILSEATTEDVTYLAEGYYRCFDADWHGTVEPHHLRPANWESVSIERLATRMIPWLSEPNVSFVKATLSPSSPSYDATAPNRVIGHAMWLLPGRTKAEIVNFWRRDASEIFSWREKMGWTKEFEDELWSAVDLEKWQDEEFLPWDRAREEYLGGIGHWLLAPIWVLPEHQGRGLTSILLKNAFDIADKADPPEPLYLEAFPDARAVYLRHGFQALDGLGKEYAMVRNPPESLKPWLQKTE